MAELEFIPTNLSEMSMYFMTAKNPRMPLRKNGKTFERSPPVSLCPNAASLQVAGGFVLPSNQDFLNKLTEPFIKERIQKTAKFNIIAASEVDVTANIDPKPQFENILGPPSGYVDDTCFITQLTNICLAQKDATATRQYDTIQYKGKKIVSIHFAGDGPNGKTPTGVFPKPGDKNQKITDPTAVTVNDFMKTELEKFQIDPNMDDVICGDTNITNGKTLKKGESSLGCQISTTLKNFSGGRNWLVIMSELKINKYRAGSFLVNPQMEKSVIPPAEGETVEGEADGTILAIKLDTSLDTITLPELLQIIPGYDTWYSFYLNGDEQRGIAKDANYFSFKEDNTTCLTPITNKLTDDVFIDHSVLQIPLAQLNRLLGINNPPNTAGANPSDTVGSNLIVLNLGSMQNSGLKSWNLKYGKFQIFIKILDNVVYDLIKSSNPDAELPDYNNITGKKLPLIPIKTSKQQLDVMCALINNVIDVFDGLPVDITKEQYEEAGAKITAILTGTNINTTSEEKINDIEATSPSNQPTIFEFGNNASENEKEQEQLKGGLKSRRRKMARSSRRKAKSSRRKAKSSRRKAKSSRRKARRG